MLRPVIASLVTAAALFGATAARAETHWSIGINLPPADVVVSSAPRYYYEPTPVYYYAPAPVVRYVPAPRHVHRGHYHVAPPPVVYERRHQHRWDDRRGRDDRRDHRDGHGPYRGR